MRRAVMIGWCRAAALVMPLACGRADASPVVAVATAGALARPVAAALDTLGAREGLRARRETAGSVELARRTADLGQPPDLLVVADAEVIAERLAPAHATWWVVFARDRMTLGHRDGSAFARRVAREPWHRAAAAPGVALGRSDPALDPAGYRALLVARLAERHLGEPGLAARLLAAAPASRVRPKSADLVALVQAGELDAAWLYESAARAAGLRTVPLGDAVDLGAPPESLAYAAVSVRVPGSRRGDSVTVRGRPIRFALTVPVGAGNPDGGARVAAFLLSAEGRRLLAAHGIGTDDPPRLAGRGAPEAVRRAVAAARAERPE